MEHDQNHKIDDVDLSDIKNNYSQLLQLCEEQNHILRDFVDECRISNEKLSKEIKFMKEKFKEMGKIIEEIAEEVLDLKYFNSQLPNVDEIMRMSLVYLQSPLNTNGHLIWGIDNFQNKMDRAIHEKQVYFSQSFLTREFGYKFQVVAYLNGTGQWENKCMLFSVELCQTPWDILLPWPCRVKITLTIVDQAGDRSKAKNETKQFKRVVLNDNAKFFRTFLPKSLLKENNYLSKDSILLVVSVSEDLPCRSPTIPIAMN